MCPTENTMDMIMQTVITMHGIEVPKMLAFAIILTEVMLVCEAMLG